MIAHRSLVGELPGIEVEHRRAIRIRAPRIGGRRAQVASPSRRYEASLGVAPSAQMEAVPARGSSAEVVR